MQKLSRILIMLCLTVTLWLGSSITPALAHPFSSNLVLPLAIFSFSGKRPDNLGVNNNQLAPCPDSPNCVSSQSSDAEHRIAPITFSSSPQEVIAKLKSTIQSLSSTKIVTETEDYLYVEFTSALMGFVDDVEFYANKDKNVLEVRSASRLGKSDLGVNRDRVETIRSLFNT